MWLPHFFVRGVFMYIVSDRQSNGYVIYDTFDRSYEFVNTETVGTLLSSGISIYGVSLVSIQYNMDVKLLLRFYDTCKDTIMSYDGYILKVEDKEEVMYNCSSIEIHDIQDKEILEDVVNILRRRNTDVYISIKSTDRIAYEFNELTDDGYYSVIDLISGQYYKFDLFDCIYTRFVEKLIINGLSIIKDSVLIESTGRIDYSVDYLWRLETERSTGCDAVEKDLNSYTEEFVEFGYNEMGNNIVVIDGTNIPLYDIDLCKKVVEDCYSSILWWKYGSIVSFDRMSGVVEFENGESSRFQYTYWFVKMLVEDNTILQDINDYCHRELIKAKVLNIKQSYDGRLDYGMVLDKASTIQLYKYVRGTTDDLIFPIRTDYGNMQIQYNRLPDTLFTTCDGFDSIFLTTLSHVGTAVYDLCEYKIKVGASKISANSLFSLSKEGILDFHNVIEYAEIHGMTSLGCNIVPLCVGRIMDYQDRGVAIWIDCLVPRYIDEFNSTGNSVITVPLHMLRGKYTEYKDCFVFKTLLHDIIMSKELVQNLFATVSGDTQQFALLDRRDKKTLQYFDMMSRSVKKLFENVNNEYGIL